MKRSENDCSRGTFLERTGVGLAAAALAAKTLTPMEARAAGGSTGPAMLASSPAEARALLRSGNERFTGGHSNRGPLNTRTVELAGGQSPFAIVLGCSDSRVPIDTIFDESPGSIFVVRIAGNFLNSDNLGSIEYAVAVLKSKIIVVLGHSKCGAVSAAVSYVKEGTTQPGHIANLVTALAPSAEATRDKPGDWVSNAIAQNVRQQVKGMTAGSKIIADAVLAGEIEVVGAVYDLHTGRVAFM